MSPAWGTSLCIVFMSILCIQYTLAFSRPSTIVLENNEYKNVVIAIHDSVAEDKAFIEKLKVLFVIHFNTLSIRCDEY